MANDPKKDPFEGRRLRRPDPSLRFSRLGGDINRLAGAGGKLNNAQKQSLADALKKNPAMKKVILEQLKDRPEILEQVKDLMGSSGGSIVMNPGVNIHQEEPHLKDPIRPGPDIREADRRKIANLEQLLRTRDLELNNKNAEITALQKQVQELKDLSQTDSNEELNRLVVELQSQKRVIEQNYTALKGKIDASYSAQDLAAYFSKAIDCFNAEMNDDEGEVMVDQQQGTVGYIINGMDVDLKAHIVKDQKTDQLLFMTDPELSGGDALSTVKISIKAFPRAVPGKGGR